MKRRRAKGKKPGAGNETTAPPEAGNSPALMEKTMAELSKFIRNRQFDSVEDLNHAIQNELMGRSMSGHEQRRASSLELAQELVWDAWENLHKRERIRLAEEALELSADCADAYALLAEEKARTSAEMKALYEEAVRAGERALGPAVLKEDVGHFWGILETRPYMRARAGLAGVLWKLGNDQEAIAHYRELLRLNPNDNQGIRYVLLTCLLAKQRDAEAESLLEEHDDGSAAWLYNRAILHYRTKGQSKESDTSLQDALKQNPHVPKYLLGKKRLPNRLPNYIGWGDEAEAVAYSAANLELWDRTQGAKSWLKERSGF